MRGRGAQVVSVPFRALTVARTLRQVAGWAEDSRTPEELRELADQVESEDYSRAACCPMCQEVECDEGCSLEGMRAP